MCDVIINTCGLGRRRPKAGGESGLDSCGPIAGQRQTNLPLDDGIGICSGKRRMFSWCTLNVAYLPQRLMRVAVHDDILASELMGYAKLAVRRMGVAATHRS